MLDFLLKATNMKTTDWWVNKQAYVTLEDGLSKRETGPLGGLQTVSGEALRRGAQTFSISYEKEITQKSLNVCKVVQEMVQMDRRQFLRFLGGGGGVSVVSPTFPGSESNECLQTDLCYASGAVWSEVERLGWADGEMNWQELNQASNLRLCLRGDSETPPPGAQH